MNIYLKRLSQLGFAAAMMSFAGVAFGQSYVTTGQSGAQTQIDINHSSFFTFTVPGGGATLNGGKFTMKDGSSTIGTITLRLFPGTITALAQISGAPLAAITQTHTDFCTGFANCGQFALHTMDFPTPARLTGGATYTAILTSDAADVQSQAYFMKPGTVTLANPGAPQPQLLKEFSVSSLTVGQTATLTLSLANNGSAAVSSIAFTDTLLTGMTFPNTTVTNGCGSGSATIVGNVLTVSGVSLSVGSSCAITATISVTQTGSLTNTTSTVSSSDPAGPAAAASASITRVAAPPVGTPSLTFWGLTALVAFATPASAVTTRSPRTWSVATNRGNHPIG